MNDRAGHITGAGRSLSLDGPLIMGILNATPDSFYDGGRYPSDEDLVERVDRILEDGADILDIGGESTRPGSDPVPATDEIERIRAAVEHALDARAFVSVDTRKPEVAHEVLDMGVHMINSVVGLDSPGLLETLVDHDAAVVIMHMKGDPATMQEAPEYANVIDEVHDLLSEQVELGLASGLRRDRIVVDPGIGFGKTPEHNLTILNSLDRFLDIGQPVMVGTSRKSFIGAVLDLPPGERLEGSLASCVLALNRGASIFRVHDVVETRRALDLAHAILVA